MLRHGTDAAQHFGAQGWRPQNLDLFAKPHQFANTLASGFDGQAAAHPTVAPSWSRRRSRNLRDVRAQHIEQIDSPGGQAQSGLCAIEARFISARSAFPMRGEIYGRKLGPLGLVLKSGVWYLVAQSGKSIRTYRVAQIVEAEIADEAFVRPKEFDLAAHWEGASRAYESGLYREQADVRRSPRGMDLLDMLGPHVAQAARSSAAPAGREGWIRCSLSI